VKTGEIILILVIFIGGFILADYLASQIMISDGTGRLMVRLVLLSQVVALIYLVFDNRDTARRVEHLEKVLRNEGKLPPKDSE
jgi:hypothetical protein